MVSATTLRKQIFWFFVFTWFENEEKSIGFLKVNKFNISTSNTKAKKTSMFLIVVLIIIVRITFIVDENTLDKYYLLSLVIYSIWAYNNSVSMINKKWPKNYF